MPLSLTDTRSLGDRASPRALDAALAFAATVLLWPVRVYKARRDLAVLGALSDHELKDIGLLRTDLSAATGLAPDEDPTLRLAHIVDDRRRYRR
ncbi:MAG: DUF1127 domain-containing protein [Alsobacter sp.]